MSRPGHPASLEAKSPSGMAVASLVLGAAAFPASCMYLGVPLAILAVLFGHVARSRIRRGTDGGADAGSADAGGADEALGGLVCGYIVLGVTVVTVLIVAFIESVLRS